MKQYKRYKKLDLINIWNEILDFWEKKSIFQKSIENRKNSSEFIFFEGPPSANGLPGIHHVMTRTIKDVFCRYQTLKGKKVFRKAGWDTHGLPVEISVEKELQITKKDIGEKISIDAYNQACKKAVMRYTDAWVNLTKKIGYWIDVENAYTTYESKYIESVWWLIKQIYNQKKLYKGYAIQPYSPKAGTGLSSHEVNQIGTYKNIIDIALTVQFKIRKEIQNNHLVWKDIIEKSIDSNVYFLAWTTTPWTLPSNTALTVGSSIEYVLVKTFNQYSSSLIYIILAKNLINRCLNKIYFESFEIADFISFKKNNKRIPYQIIKKYLGKDLVGIYYEQLITWVIPYENSKNAFQVIEDNFVTMEHGTGIVHTAPTFGVDDARVAKKYNIPSMLVIDDNKKLIPIVDLEGKFIAIQSIPKNFRGKFIKNEYYPKGKAPQKSIDLEIFILLKSQNKVFNLEKYLHNYPHCWRTDTPILYYPLDSWFIKVTKIREQLVNFNQTINWKPKYTGEKRFMNWLENASDWNLSRSRFWGIPLPIWRTIDQKEEICIGSLKEFMIEINKSVKAKFLSKNPFENFIVGDLSEDNYNKIDLHKNIVDSIILISENGQRMYRESDVIDVWFDSGAMPYAQVHYPFSEEKIPLNADFIAEGVDQTRGWFYTLHIIAVMIFNQVAYKNVISNGLVLDKNGQKMSKRIGNTIDPIEVLNTYGPDAVRWYMISHANPWENLKFDVNSIDEIVRKFFGKLHSAYSFFVLYANTDKFFYHENEIPYNNRCELDRWIISELNLLIKITDQSYSNYEPTHVARLINNFVCTYLSNWYIRLNRRRFWKGEYSQDKISAFQTLYRCLETITILSSPIAPFYSDKLFQNLNQITKKNSAISVHLVDFPIYYQNQVDNFLIKQIHTSQEITSIIFSLRKKKNIKVRQPLSKVLISITDNQIQNHLKINTDLIKQEVNVKEISIISQEKAKKIIYLKQARPNFKILGPKFGKKIKLVTKLIENLNSKEIIQLEKSGKIFINRYEILLSEIEIITNNIPGWLVTSNKKFSIALDINLNNELIQEGIAREFINRIQNIRKEKHLNLTDRINITISNNIFNASLIKFKNYIMQEVLALNLTMSEIINSDHEIEINKEKIKIIITKI